MRDGVEIAVDLIMPSGEGPWPAIVNRTPYMRGRHLRPESWMRLVDRGYVFVAVDVRGRGDSDGIFKPFVNDADDGHDTIEWVASQDWCTGRVGMVGSSYEGLTQWWSAKGKPPHLRCIVPQAVGAVEVGPRRSCDTGVPVQYWIWWFNLVTGRTFQHPGAPSWEANYGHLPLRTLDEAVGTSRDWWPSYVAGEIDFMGPSFVLTADDWATLDVPTLISVGWWDDQTTMATWMALSRSPAGASSHLLIGGWDHAGNQTPRPVLGGLDVSASAIDVIEYVERFLALHLKDQVGETDDIPRCQVFRTGAMRWERLDEWPNPHTTPVAWYLSADWALESHAVRESGNDSYLYDPSNPVRDFSNLDAFAWSDPPLDSRYLLRRDDVLVYASHVLRLPIDVSGRALFEGFVSVDCADTDLAVHLFDLYPDGHSIALGTPSIQRLVYRNGPDPRPLPPGEPVRVEIPITWLHHTFLPGHRIQLALSSSAYPEYARNLNRGEPWADATEQTVAQVTIHRGPENPSRLVLPVESTSKS